MRELRVVVLTKRGTLPLLVAAGLIPAPACGNTTENGTHAVDASASGAGGGSGGDFIVLPNTGGTGGTLTGLGGLGGTDAGLPGCVPSGFYDTYIVELPAEGVPADPGQICSATASPVDSNRAARVTLQIDPSNAQIATGFVEIDPRVQASVVGLPTVEVIDATDPALLTMQISSVVAENGGFSFQATWSSAIYPSAGYSRMTVRVTLEVDCAPNPSQIVHSATDIHLCNGADGSEWVSSGDRCIVCRVVAEMAPSPIVPDRVSDDLPLAQALRLRVVELARISNRVVLLAENDGGPNLDYEWHASSGLVEQLSPDVVVWTLEAGMPDPLIQVAVSGESAAAVASFAFNEAA